MNYSKIQFWMSRYTILRSLLQKNLDRIPSIEDFLTHYAYQYHIFGAKGAARVLSTDRRKSLQAGRLMRTKGLLQGILFSERQVRQRGLFDTQAITEVKEEFLDGRRHCTQPWLLMMVELWCREVLDSGTYGTR